MLNRKERKKGKGYKPKYCKYRKSCMKNVWVVSWIVLSSFALRAQQNTDTSGVQSKLHVIGSKQTKIARVGLIGLTSWAAGNLIIGGVGMSRTKGEDFSFHEMNFYFNTVNLVLGGLGVVSTYKTKPTDFKSLMDYNHSIEKVYLFNVALDLGYMASGWAIYNKGLSQAGGKAQRSYGYGKSLVLQGGFLFVYDLIMFSQYRSCRKKLDLLWPNLSVSTTGLGFRAVYSFK